MSVHDIEVLLLFLLLVTISGLYIQLRRGRLPRHRFLDLLCLLAGGMVMAASRVFLGAPEAGIPLGFLAVGIVFGRWSERGGIIAPPAQQS